MEDPKKNKYDFLLYLLEKGDAMVCLDARHRDVDVPKSYKSNPSLNLIFNLNFKRPIDITEEGVFAPLEFQGQPYSCAIPFESIWAIFIPSFKEGQVWEEDIPQDVDLTTQMVPSMKKKTPIKTVPGSSAVGKAFAKPSAKRDRSHLRIIK